MNDCGTYDGFASALPAQGITVPWDLDAPYPLQSGSTPEASLLCLDTRLGEDVYRAALDIRLALIASPHTRSEAQRLLQLATDFDLSVGEAIARAPELATPASVVTVRMELATRQREVLAAIAERFFSLLGEYWKRASAVYFVILALVTYVYATLLSRSLGPDIGGLATGSRSAALLDFLQGAWPLAIMLLLTLYLLTIHLAAHATGCRNARSPSPAATDPWISALIVAHSTPSLMIAVAVAFLILFAPLVVLSDPTLGLANGLANSPIN